MTFGKAGHAFVSKNTGYFTAIKMAVIFQSSCQLDSLLLDDKDILEGRVIFGGR